MTNINNRQGVFTKILLLTLILIAGLVHLVRVIDKGEFLLKATLILREDSPVYFWSAVSFYCIGLICVLRLLLSYFKESND